MIERWLRRANLMMPPEGQSADGGGGGGGSGPGGDAGTGAAPSPSDPASSPSPSSTSDAAPSAAPATDAVAPSTGDGAASPTEITPSLLSSADPKGSQEPAASEAAPAADPSKDGDAGKQDTAQDTGTDAKAADTPAQDPTKDPTKEPAKEPAKDGGEAKDKTEPAKGDPAPIEVPALSLADLQFGEGFDPQAETSQAFLDILNDRDLAGKDRGQRLLDLHKAEIARAYQDVNQHQQDFWQTLNRGWRDQLRNDPELGGSQFNTNLAYARGVIEMMLSPEETEAFLKHTDANGMGNYPPFIRLLSRVARKLEVFEDGINAANPVPNKPQRGPGNRGWYTDSLEKPAT